MADEDCTRQVKRVPRRINSSTDQNPNPLSEAMPSSRAGYCSKSGMAPCSSCMPTSSRARPMTVCAIDFIFSLFEKMNNKLTAAKSMGRLNALDPSPSPSRVIIQAVAVVPMLAPMMTATAPPSDINPALTKPTTITVVADDDWMTAVTAVPVRMPLSGLSVILPKMVRIRLPAAFCSPSLIIFMANKKMASAPVNLMIISRMSMKSMVCSFLFSIGKNTD